MTFDPSQRPSAPYARAVIEDRMVRGFSENAERLCPEYPAFACEASRAQGRKAARSLSDQAAQGRSCLPSRGGGFAYHP